jgi:hypothetical protein
MISAMISAMLFHSRQKRSHTSPKPQPPLPQKRDLESVSCTFDRPFLRITYPTPAPAPPPPPTTSLRKPRRRLSRRHLNPLAAPTLAVVPRPTFTIITEEKMPTSSSPHYSSGKPLKRMETKVLTPNTHKAKWAARKGRMSILPTIPEGEAVDHRSPEGYHGFLVAKGKRFGGVWDEGVSWKDGSMVGNGNGH